jgi:hypothetical protein
LYSSPSGALACLPLPAPSGRENLSVQNSDAAQSIEVFALDGDDPEVGHARTARDRLGVVDDPDRGRVG